MNHSIVCVWAENCQFNALVLNDTQTLKVETTALDGEEVKINAAPDNRCSESTGEKQRGHG